MDKGTTGRECYAKTLGGCGGKLSREHFVSNTILQQIESAGRLNVVGLPLGGTAGRPVSADSLTAKFLCQTHNSELSPVDVAGEKFLMEFFRANKALSEGMLAADTVVSVDGTLVERWLLKYVCGLIASGNAGMVDARVNKTPPPLGLLKVLFGKVPLGGDLGLYSMPHSITSSLVSFSLTPTWAHREGNSYHLTGVEMRHYGLHTFLKLVADFPPTEGIDLTTAVYRPDSYELTRPATGRKARIELKWPHPPIGNRLEVAVVTKTDAANS